MHRNTEKPSCQSPLDGNAEFQAMVNQVRAALVRRMVNGVALIRRMVNGILVRVSLFLFLFSFWFFETGFL